jgi:predicted nucleic acid-binding protein
MGKELIFSILSQLLPLLFKLLTPEVVKRAADAGLDIIEKAAANSSNKVDDAIILSLCSTIRAAFSIPDND